MDPRHAPSRDLVKAYMLAQNSEGGKAMMADLETTVELISRDKYDKEGRIDPLRLAAADAVREFYRRMKTIPAMATNPEWQKIDRDRQLVAANAKMEKQNG